MEVWGDEKYALLRICLLGAWLGHGLLWKGLFGACLGLVYTCLGLEFWWSALPLMFNMY
jgi:hypothetical protein